MSSKHRRPQRSAIIRAFVKLRADVGKTSCETFFSLSVHCGGQASRSQNNRLGTDSQATHLHRALMKCFACRLFLSRPGDVSNKLIAADARGVIVEAADNHQLIRFGESSETFQLCAYRVSWTDN